MRCRCPIGYVTSEKESGLEMSSEKTFEAMALDGNHPERERDRETEKGRERRGREGLRTRSSELERWELSGSWPQSAWGGSRDTRRQCGPRSGHFVRCCWQVRETEAWELTSWTSPVALVMSSFSGMMGQRSDTCGFERGLGTEMSLRVRTKLNQ